MSMNSLDFLNRNLLWEGENLRVSARYSWVCKRYADFENEYTYESVYREPERIAIIEKLVGVDKDGQQQWVIVKNPHPQTKELAEGILDVAGLDRVVSVYAQKEMGTSSGLYWEFVEKNEAKAFFLSGGNRG